jgi:ligand-binding sensor domain-containing protein/signal transduction histidine kinase
MGRLAPEDWTLPPTCHTLLRLLGRISRVLLFQLTLACQPSVADSSTNGPDVPRVGVAQAVVQDSVIRFPIIEAGGLRFRRISTSDGLSQTRAAQIVQDDQGFIWFGTQYGINRYDGYEFKVFVHDPKQPNSLCGSYVHALFKDRSGMLWIGCNQLVDRFDPRTETFTHYRVEPEGPDNQNMTVFHISQDREGVLWLATNTGLHSLDAATGVIRHFRHTLERPDGLSTNDIKWTGEDRNGSFWVGSRDGLDEFDRRTGTVLLHIPVPDLLQVSFFEDHAGRFWITQVTGSGLALYDRSTHTLTRFSFYERDPPPGNYTGVTGIVEDREGNLWLGSPGMGLLRFEPASRRFIRYRSRPHDSQSIGEDKVIGLFEDQAGNIWVGLNAVGPNYFVPYPSHFTTFKHDPDETDSLPTDFVNAIYEDSQGTLWLGNDQGLYEYDRRAHKGKLITAGLGANPTVISVIEDRSGIIWFGTYGHGVVSYDPRSGTYSIYRHDYHDPSSLCNDIVHRLFVDHRGTLWIGTEGGLSALDPGSQRFRNYYAGSEGVAGQYYLTIAEDKAGTLWLGTGRSGLQHFDPATGHLTEYKPSRQDPDGLRDNVVQSVYVSASGVIWIGTQNGLNELDPATGKFKGYDTGDGMPANFVSCLIEDDRGDLWLSTTRGISRFDPQSHAFSNYSVSDGLPGYDFTGWSACSKSSRGELFFGGYSGGVAFLPDSVRATPPMPRVVLTSLEVSGATVPIGPNELLQESISYTRRLILRREQDSFALQFAGIDYVSPEANRVRYRMEGLDPLWYETRGNIRRASYSALPAGDYEFQVQAASARGSWNEPGTSLHITILPPWWATWWFRTAYIAFALLVLGAVYVIRMRQLSRQLTIRMEERITERTRIARDLHDTFFQGIQGLLLRFNTASSLLEKDQASARTILRETLEKSDGVMLEGRELMLDLREGAAKTKELADALALAGSDLSRTDTSGFQVAVFGDPRPLHPVVFEELHRFGREALSNAFRHAQAKTIEAELHYERNQLRLRIRDDGVGIDEQVLNQGFRAGHWGLPGMRERASKIAGHLDIWSRAGAGTEIELRVPATVAYSLKSRRSRLRWLTEAAWRRSDST